LNSQGTQDLIVNVLATKRYELANYSNVAIPTNLRVRNEVRDGFASFYEALFARTIEQNPNTVVTEYSWSAGSCDPCPTPPLTPQDIATLGGDVLQGVPGQNGSFASPFNFTLTRLHARYTKDNLGEDLIFQPATGITGGQGIPDAKGALDQPVRSGSGDWNSFQGRYVILHPWEKTLTCSDPIRGRWGGPPAGVAGSTRPQAPANSALTGTAPAMGDLPALLAESLPALSVTASSPLDPVPGLPISAGATPARGITGTSRPPASTTTPPLPAATDNSTSSSSRAPRNDSGSCSAAPGKRAGSSLAIGLLTAAVAFAARRRRNRAGGAA
jgi:MYXO-CTERM domain-containing protein